MRHLPLVAALLALVLGAGVPALAQESITHPEDGARFRLGPVHFTPTVQIRNVGVDTNIFNENEEPKQDFVASFGPAADYWVPAGRSRLSGRTALQYDYFNKYSDQRAFGTDNAARYEVLFNHVIPFVAGQYTNTRRRPEFEIDARARYRTDAIKGGADLRLFSRTVVRLEAEHGHLKYDDGQTFEGSNLADVLNRQDTLYRVSLRHALTPLTTFVLATESRRDRFDTSTVRDADGTRVVPGFEFKPGAIINGRAMVGYASFRTLSADVPDFHGIVANLELTYTARATRVITRLVRDANYSFELDEPYYVVTDVGVEASQKITSTWDIVGRIGRQTLDYRQFVSLGPTERTDHGWRTGFGMGRAMNRALRVGVDVDYVKRESPVATRTYDGWRVGGSISYGL